MAQKLLAKQLCPEFQQGFGPRGNYVNHYITKETNDPDTNSLPGPL